MMEIKTLYLFAVKTPTTEVLIRCPETEWSMDQQIEMIGPDVAVNMLRRDFRSAIGMYGTLINIDRTTPMDINAALVDLKQQGKIIDFQVVGYIPDESPAQVGDDGEEREIEWDEEDEDAITESAYAGNIGFMEMVEFYRVASQEQLRKMEQIVKRGDWSQFKAIINDVLGIILK